jgi:ATP-dependent protease ClpP protease subunit
MTNKLELFDTVGEQITVDLVKSFLNANKQNDVQFDISSLGGDLATALTIHDLIQQHPKTTTANIVGLTASAGTVIAIACDNVKMSDNALFLIHNGWKTVEGNVYDMQKAVTDLAKTDAVMTKIYREKTGLPDSQIISLMKASDWLSSTEALDYGFIDSVYQTGSKIAASAVLTEARKAQINELLLTKLQTKMKIFGKNKAEKVLNVLAMKDGKQCLVEGEAAVGSEVAPLGATALEDGTYELTDGRVVTIAGGVITNVETPKEPEGTDASSKEVIAAVSALVVAEIAKVEAKVMAELGKIQSTHTPPKGAGPANAPNAQVTKPDVSAKIKEVTDGIMQKIAESRKA